MGVRPAMKVVRGDVVGNRGGATYHDERFPGLGGEAERKPGANLVGGEVGTNEGSEAVAEVKTLLHYCEAG